YGLLCGKQMGYKSLVVESDAWAIIHGINSSGHCEAIYGNVIEDIKMLSRDFEACLFYYISREDNKRAHTTAFFAREHLIECVCQILLRGSILFCNLHRSLLSF
ncbi:RVT_3 domain-containing protein, partial [Cephalotus follicularis]